MDSVINDRLSEVRDLKDIMRSLVRMHEVKSGTFRVACGATKGQLNFQDGYVVAAAASAGNDLHGKAAFELLMSLPEIVSEFVAEQAPLADRRDELCIEISQLVQNHFSLEGIPWAPRIGKVRTKTGQLPGFVGRSLATQDEDVDTVSIIATHAAAEINAMANERERDEQEATGPMQAQQNSEQGAPAYDLSALDAIPTPGAGKAAPPAAKLGAMLSQSQPAPQPAAPTPQPAAPAPQPSAASAPTPAYDLSALEAIPTPGAGKAANLTPSPQPAMHQPAMPSPQAPMPSSPQPSAASAPTPAYDLSALEAIPTPGAGKAANLTPGPQPAMQQPAMPSPQAAMSPSPQPSAASAPTPAYDLSALEAIPTPGAGKAANLTPSPQPAMQPMPSPTPQPSPAASAPAPAPAPTYDLSALEAIPTPGAPKAPQVQPQSAPQAQAPQPPQPAAAPNYDLSALESIPTPGAKPRPAGAPEAAGLMKRMAQTTEGVKSQTPPMQPAQPAPQVVAEESASSKPYDLSALESIPTPGAKPAQAPPTPMTSMTSPAPSMAAQPPQAPPPVAPVSSPEEMMKQWSSGETPAAGFPMQRVATVLLVLTLLLAAFVVPGMIRQSMKPANVEADMNKSQVKGLVTDQMKDQTPYAH